MCRDFTIFKVSLNIPALVQHLGHARCLQLPIYLPNESVGFPYPAFHVQGACSAMMKRLLMACTDWRRMMMGRL